MLEKKIRLANGYWLLLVLALLACDQAAKILAINHLTLHNPLTLLPILNFTLSHNTGVAFGFFANISSWQPLFFTIFAAAVSVFVVIWIIRLPQGSYWTATALSLVCSGALGNLLDRLRHGYVIDFIDFHWSQYHFAIFNLADTLVFCGVALLILEQLFHTD